VVGLNEGSGDLQKGVEGLPLKELRQFYRQSLAIGRKRRKHGNLVRGGGEVFSAWSRQGFVYKDSNNLRDAYPAAPRWRRKCLTSGGCSGRREESTERPRARSLQGVLPSTRSTHNESCIVVAVRSLDPSLRKKRRRRGG